MGSLPRAGACTAAARCAAGTANREGPPGGAGVPSQGADDAAPPAPGGRRRWAGHADPARRNQAKRSRLPAPEEPAPGIGRLALDGAVETAKLPLRLAEHLTRQALVSVARGLRRD